MTAEKEPDLDVASRQLAAAIGDDIYWLAEGGKRHFIDPFTAGTLSYLLLTVFLKSAAAAAGAAAGKLAWDGAVHLAREVLAGRQKPDAEALRKEAETARGSLASLSETSRDAALDSARESLGEALGKFAPPGFAKSMAGQVKQAASSVLTS
jgi:hypothetical protein